jgi:hypothetical protein
LTAPICQDRLLDVRQTPLSLLIAHTLGIDLGVHVRGERAQGADWRTIAADLSERSGHSVSHESVRSWFADEAETPMGPNADAGSANPAFLLVPVALLLGLLIPYSYTLNVAVYVLAIPTAVGLGVAMLRGRRDRVQP